MHVYLKYSVLHLSEIRKFLPEGGTGSDSGCGRYIRYEGGLGLDYVYGLLKGESNAALCTRGVCHWTLLVFFRYPPPTAGTWA